MEAMYFSLCNRYMPDHEKLRGSIMEHKEKTTDLPPNFSILLGCAEHYTDKEKAWSYYDDTVRENGEYADDAINNTGYLHLGQSKSQSEQTIVAAKYFIILAKNKNMYALNNLANMMYTYGSEKHRHYAIQLYKEISKKNPTATYSLGVICMNSGEISEATEYFKESNTPMSDHKLAIIHTSEKYKKYPQYKNLAKGIEYINSAIKYNYPYIYSVYGDIYYDGYCCEQDLPKAFEYYTMAIERKDYSVCEKLFEFYIADKRESDAIDILQKGIDNIKDNKKLLGRFYNKLGLYYSQQIKNPESKEKYKDLAYANLQQAMANGNVIAEYNMGNFLIKKIAAPDSIKMGCDILRNYYEKTKDIDAHNLLKSVQKQQVSFE